MTTLPDDDTLQQVDILLRDAILDIFFLMIPLEITAGEPVRHGSLSVASDITSMIGLAGDIKGFLALHCPQAVAVAITAAMLDKEVHSLDEDVRDALGEVVNMIAGGLKTGLAGIGKNTVLALPTTIVGKGVRTGSLSGACRRDVPFATRAGQFVVEITSIFS